MPPDQPVDRVSADDLVQLAYQCPPGAAQVGGLLLLSGPAPGLAEVRAALAGRVPAVPRLRQRMYPLPLGYGRPVWVDDAGFDVSRHVTEVACPPPGDEPALLGVAAGIAYRPLPLERPLWSATLVTGLAGDRAALLLVLHHVLADGLGGLAALAHLVDPAAPDPTAPDPTAPDPTAPDPAAPDPTAPDPAGPYGAPAGTTPAGAVAFPRPRPSRATLRADAGRDRRRALSGLRLLPSRLPAAVAELRAGATGRVPRSSLNRYPTGRRRELRVVRVDLARARAAAHRHGATVNDLLLAAIAGALGRLLRDRGERVATVVASVPVSGRDAGTASTLGNRVGVMRLALPTGGSPKDRLRAVTAATRAAKRVAPESSTALLGPVFRTLAALRLTCWFTNHQRLVNTFVTNVAGPPRPLRLLGRPVAGMTGVSGLAGNVTVAFTILSYAGTLSITLVSDPDRCPDAGALAAHLAGDLAALDGAGA